MIASTRPVHYDCILIGGGLQSGLLAMALNNFHPESSVLVIERRCKIAGNHTWSFHPGDVPETCRSWVEPLVEERWEGYEVLIGSCRRHVALPYATISSPHFASIVEGVLRGDSGERLPQLATGEQVSVDSIAGTRGQDLDTSDFRTEIGNDTAWRDSDSDLLTNTVVSEIGEDYIATVDGRVFQSNLIIDCRGPSCQIDNAGCGYQKFFGFELELAEAWDQKYPAVMESVDDQRDGFRFLYSLPFAARRVMIEDTCFSDSPDLDRDECWQVVAASLQRRGIVGARIVREESGVLPMPFLSEGMPAAGKPLAGGYAGGWFHAATGYSFPMAVAFAHAVASGPLQHAEHRVRELAEQHRWRARYARFLNRLLFRLVTPEHRFRIFQRFYRVLDDDAVARFYAHRFRILDAFRIVVGIPPTLIGLRPFRFIRSFFSGAR